CSSVLTAIDPTANGGHPGYSYAVCRKPLNRRALWIRAPRSAGGRKRLLTFSGNQAYRSGLESLAGHYDIFDVAFVLTGSIAALLSNQLPFLVCLAQIPAVALSFTKPFLELVDSVRIGGF